MPSPRDIRRRIKSVKNTAQITKAMEKVAQAKMAKAQQAALNGRPYAEVMNRVLSEVATHAGEFEHPYMVQRAGDRRRLRVGPPQRERIRRNAREEERLEQLPHPPR